MITHTDLDVDEDLGRRVLSLARSIAPCLDSFEDESEEKKNAIAILKGVIAELPATGSRRTRSMSRNGSSLTLSDIGSVFTDDDRVSLRALCGSTVADVTPVGSFPKHSGLGRTWPEGEYT